MAKKKAVKKKRAKRTPSKMCQGQVWLLAPNTFMHINTVFGTSCTFTIRDRKGDDVSPRFCVDAATIRLFMDYIKSKYIETVK